MKRSQKQPITLEWEPEVAFRVPLQQTVPVARSLSEFFPVPFLQGDDELWAREALP